MEKSIVFTEITKDLCTVWSRTPPEPLGMVVIFPAHDAGKALALHYSADLRDALQIVDADRLIAAARDIKSRMSPKTT